jgi:hypothetical protein
MGLKRRYTTDQILTKVAISVGIINLRKYDRRNKQSVRGQR